MFSFEAVRQAMGDLREQELYAAMDAIMAEGGSDAQSAMEAMQNGMDIVGQRYEEGEYFVGDLIYAGDVMSKALERIKPALAAGFETALGRMLLCTVKDDLHDIGKNIVKSMLQAAGFDVLDLGVDTPAKQIVETAQQEGIRIIALSGVLLLALDSMKATVDAFKAAGMREDVRIIIGGTPVSADACDMVGADEWAFSPQKTINTCKRWAQELG